MFNLNYHLSTLTWQPIVISVNTYEALELHMPILRKEHLIQCNSPRLPVLLIIPNNICPLL